MEIMIEIRDVYGEEKYYPACDKAMMFAKLCGTKTLTKHAIATIKQLGYSINIKQLHKEI